MKNKVLVLVLLVFTNSCADLIVKDKNLITGESKQDIISQIKINCNQDDLIKHLGEPDLKSLSDKQNLNNDKSNLQSFVYFDKEKNKNRTRYSFIFKNNLLIKKYMNVYEDDIESDIAYWKKKYPEQTFKSEEALLLNKHITKKINSIEIERNKFLELENDKIVRIAWE